LKIITIQITIFYFVFIIAVDLTEKNIINYIKSVTNWFELGLQLDFEVPELDIIRANNPLNVQSAKIALISCWLKDKKNPSWEKLAEALNNISQRNLATRIYELTCSKGL